MLYCMLNDQKSDFLSLAFIWSFASLRFVTVPWHMFILESDPLFPLLLFTSVQFLFPPTHLFISNFSLRIISTISFLSVSKAVGHIILFWVKEIVEIIILVKDNSRHLRLTLCLQRHLLFSRMIFGVKSYLILCCYWELT